MNNYSNTEKSLKRWLKTKVKVTMATVIGFLIAGTVAMGETINIEESSQSQKISKDNFTIFEDEKNGAVENTVTVSNTGKLEITSSNIEITKEGNGTKMNTGYYQSTALKVQSGGNVILGNSLTENINIKVTGGDTEKSILSGLSIVGKTGDMSVNAKNLTITAHNNLGYVYGINVNNTTSGGTATDVAKMVINAENTVINVTADKKIDTDDGDNHAVGINVMSEGQLEVNGNLTVTADTAIATRGNSSVLINKNNDKTIKLTGDISFNYDKETSGTTVDSGLTLNLSNEASYFNGKISITGNPESGKDQVNGMKLGLSNGGKWEVTGDSFVNDLTMNGGILEVTDDVEKIDVDRLHGDSGIATFSTTIDGDNVNVADGQINIGEVKDNTSLEVGFLGIDADDLAGKDLNKVFGELQNKVNVTTGADKVDETYFAKEGQVTGEITAKDDGNGNLVITQAEESKTVTGLKDLATINYLSWKQEMGSLTQRMGELRDSSAEHGVWARVYGGKVENGSQYDNEYQTYQVGYDKKYSVDNGRVYLGYLVSYTDGETDYDLGHGENYSVGAGIYATWMNNNGHYVDVLYKVSRLNNKFDVASNNAEVGKSHGDYDTYGISLSAEYGKRFDITEKWFAEPSIGMHFGRLGEETYTTDSGIEVSQDSIYTAEGRIGTAVGYKFNDKGNVYARTHVVKEFAGDVDAEYTANGATSKTSEDMGDTWFEFGVGVNYRFAENVNVYADIEKSGDSTVDTEWQGNLGFRYEF